jgi:hypothetical protein
MWMRDTAGVLALSAMLGACSSAQNEPADSSGPDDGKASTATALCPTGAGTGFLGDDVCLAAPASDSGFQLHYGPSDYDDPDEVAKYLVEPGQEKVACYFAKTANATDVFSSGYQIHMRPGSHHLILATQNEPVPDGFTTCGTAPVGPGGLGGTQVPIVDELVDPAPENQGLAIKVAARTQAMFNFHLINTTSAPVLSEAWAYYLYAPRDAVEGYRGAVFLAGGLGFRIERGEKQTYRYSCSPSAPSRILQLAAHMHEHAVRMTAWKISGNERTRILESYKWDEPGQVRFDTVHDNPAPIAASRATGADISGDLVVMPDERVEWECAVENDGNTTLTFRNEVLTGEMCVLTGTQVRADDPMQPSDFTCIRN